MYVTEYWVINKNTKTAVRGVLMYREKRDLAERRQSKILAIYSVYRAFPKRSQRKGMWQKLCWKEPSHIINVELTTYFTRYNTVGEERSVFGFQVRALRKRLRPMEKNLFDSFYYERS